MHKIYNLTCEDGFGENIFLEMMHTSSFREGSPIESVFPGCTDVYHVLDTTAQFDRQLKPDIINPLKRTSTNPFLEIYASNKRKIRRAIKYLEEITSKEFEEVKGVKNA